VGRHFFLTSPELGWTRERAEAHLRGLGSAALILDAAREVTPGRATQRAALERAARPARRHLAAPSALEGWAQYAEQLLLDEGFGDGDLRLRLLERHRALVAWCRLAAVIDLHAGEATPDEAAELFMRRAVLDAAEAQQEARAAAADPGRMLAALGKRRLLELREEVLERNPGSAAVQSFHADFLAAGAAPFRVTREILSR
jgi:uncharacterized protein (DUF885 family)